jgi:hypothetical protein
MIQEENKFCVYLTIYTGNKMPMFYIGSTSIEKIKLGYRGSVTSKAYKEIWKTELRSNPHLFKTNIISTHNTRMDSLEKENKLQVCVDAVYNTLYINKGYAYKTFGDQTSERMSRDNPMKNKVSINKMIDSLKTTWETDYDNMYTKIITPERNAKIRVSKLGILNPNYGNSNAGKQLLITGKCLHCDMVASRGNITRWHNDNCDKNPINVNNPFWKNKPLTGEPKFINIYNAKNEMMFSTHRTFKFVCVENKLPASALVTSYTNNGRPLTNKKYPDFIGWYAKRE